MLAGATADQPPCKQHGSQARDAGIRDNDGPAPYFEIVRNDPGRPPKHQAVLSESTRILQERHIPLVVERIMIVPGSEGSTLESTQAFHQVFRPAQTSHWQRNGSASSLNLRSISSGVNHETGKRVSDR
jgi:hypothetical protein